MAVERSESVIWAQKWFLSMISLVDGLFKKHLFTAVERSESVIWAQKTISGRDIIGGQAVQKTLFYCCIPQKVLFELKKMISGRDIIGRCNKTRVIFLPVFRVTKRTPRALAQNRRARCAHDPTFISHTCIFSKKAHLIAKLHIFQKAHFKSKSAYLMHISLNTHVFRKVYICLP